MIDSRAEIDDRYPWLADVAESLRDDRCEARRAKATTPATPADCILPIRIQGVALNMPLTRYDAGDRLPADHAVCYVEEPNGRLTVAIYAGDRWLDRKRRPLSFDPTVWFKIGGGD